MKGLLLLMAALGITSPALATDPQNFGVELHAHIFMKEGMGWAFRGDFFGPRMAHNWRDSLSSQANPESINRSQLSILVATLYAHPLFNLSLRDSIRRQIALAERFVRENPQWTIARNAKEAREVINKGGRVLILALEGASGIIENDDDIREFVDEKGIRIVTFLHLSDDHLGGVAFLKGVKVLAAPFALLRRFFHRMESNGVPVNDQGLTAEGVALARKLMDHGVWIDLAHASDASQEDLFPMIHSRGLPLLYTHTSLRSYLRAERGISFAQLREVKSSRGVVGLMPTEDMLENTPTEKNVCPKFCPEGCAGSFAGFIQQYNEIANHVEPQAVTLGSDFNGGIGHLKATPCLKAEGFSSEGFWNIGQWGLLWKAMGNPGASIPSAGQTNVDYFLNAWARVNPPSPQKE